MPESPCVVKMRLCKWGVYSQGSHCTLQVRALSFVLLQVLFSYTFILGMRSQNLNIEIVIFLAKLRHYHGCYANILFGLNILTNILTYLMYFQ